MQERGAPCVPAGPYIAQRGDESALTQTTRRCGSLLDFRRWRGQRHSFPRRRAGGESFILFRRWLKGQRYPLYQVRTIPFPPSFQVHGSTVCDALPPHSHPRPICQRQESAVRGRSTSPRTSSQSLQGLREFCEDESERRAFCTIQPYSHSLHHCGYVDCAVGATCTASGGVACAAQPVSLAHAHNSTRLRDSVRQATSQVQRRSRDCGAARNAPVLREEIAVLLARMQSSRSLQPR